MYEENLETVHSHQGGQVNQKKEYKKLAFVFGLIFICATIMSFVLGFDWQEWMRWFMGGFFIIFGSFKLIGYEDFITMFPRYDPIAKRIPLYNYSYPFIELFLGFLYCSNLAQLPRDVITLTLLSVGAWGILRYTSMQSESEIQCACLGNVIKLPLSNISLYEDVIMAVMAGLMLVSTFIYR